MRRNVKRHVKQKNKRNLVKKITKSFFAGVIGTSMCIGVAHGEPVKNEQKLVSFSVAEDRFTHQFKLNLSVDRPIIGLADGKAIHPISFYIYNNYPDFIGKYRISIYRNDDVESKRPLKVIDISNVNPYLPIKWDGVLENGKTVHAGVSYKAILEVWDKSGKHRDVTLPVTIDAKRIGKLDKAEKNSATDIPGFGADRTAKRTINGQYNTVVIQGKGLQEQAMLNGQVVIPDKQGCFVRELTVAPGKYTYVLESTDLEGKTLKEEQTIQVGQQKNVDKNEFFMVAIADVTVGKNSVRGNVETLGQDDHYDGRLYKDGRVAFYLKGKVKGSYLLTAQLDTGEGKLSEIFGKIDEKDPKRIFRELDPNNYYPVYGDTSTVTSDVNSEGKFYLKLENDKDQLLWGNYNTGMTGSEYAQYNRSLYGLQVVHESKAETKFGDNRDYMTAFAAVGQHRLDHNEFLSTGGILYYLRHQRVSEGSDKIQVEVRDRNSGRTKEKITLTRGTDYEINAFEGRLLLKNPVALKAKSDSIISQDLQSGDDLVLVADYEYYSDGLKLSADGAQGARGYHWIGDTLRVGGSYLQEKGDIDQYRLQEIDITLKQSKGTYTYLEMAKSRNKATIGSYSDDGGIIFSDMPSSVASNSGHAYKMQQVIDFRDFSKGEIPLTFEGYATRRNAGFSSVGKDADVDIKELGGEFKYEPEDGLTRWLVKHNRSERVTDKTTEDTGLQFRRQMNNKLTGTIEVAKHKENTPLLGTTRQLLGAVKVEKEIDDKGSSSIYVIQQVTMQRDQAVTNNNKTTIGYTNNLSEKITGNVEVFSGNRGEGGSLGIEKRNNRDRIYSRFTTDVDSTAVRTHTAAFGGEYYMNSKTDIYSERQFKSNSDERSTGDVYGVRYHADKNQTVEASYSIADAKQSVITAGSPITRREVANIGYSYSKDNADYHSRIELRKDNGVENKKQYVLTNRARKNYKNGWALLGQYDYALTKDLNTLGTDAKFVETALGFAYRPVGNDRLNLFGKISYINGLSPASQFIANGTSESADNYEQKSWVYSMEGDWQLSKRYDVAFKAATRRGMMKYTDGDAWISSGANLYGVRLNYTVNKKWDAFTEYRALQVQTAQDTKAGWMCGVSYKTGKNSKLGVGYNFTNYNDDLTHLNYKAKGWFVNMLGQW